MEMIIYYADDTNFVILKYCKSKWKLLEEILVKGSKIVR